MRPKPFRIVHLSDLHLTASDSTSRSEPRLYGKLKGMNAAFRCLTRSAAVQRADQLVVTGDVTDRGEKRAWRVFWEAIDRAGLLERTLVIPGNHDLCCLGLRAPDRDRVARDLAKARRGLALGGQAARQPWAQVIDPRIVVFGLDSNNTGNLSGISNAAGRLDYGDLAALARLMATYSAVPVKIVLMHHSPNIPRGATEAQRELPVTGNLGRLARGVPEDQRRALRLLCIAHRVRLVLHGHLHRAEDRRVDGVRMVGVGASTEPQSDDSGARFYELATYSVQGAGGRIIRRRTRVPVPS